MGDAKQWFEETNRNVRHNRTASLVDHDPPFFFQDNPYSDDGMSARAVPSQGSFNHPSPSLQAHQARQANRFGCWSEDNSEGFRSVIDDLTIQNKRLKQRLKSYEKRSARYLQRDKLFEVRIHALPPRKKRELEDLLRRFTLGLGDCSPPTTGSPVPHLTRLSRDKGPSANPSSVSTTQSRPVDPSSVSTASRHVDSAYASVSTSALTCAALNNSEKHRAKRMAGSKDHRVESYLSDIPTGLFPQQSLVMTDKAKKKLVVKKLEQLFTGKAPEVGEYSQPLQQQEVSKSAAQADRSATEARGQRLAAEGKREASMMVPELRQPSRLLAADRPGSLESAHLIKDLAGNDARITTPMGRRSSGSLEQRPTRPLDLDPHRAQRPAENIQYLRHLGLTCNNPNEPNGADFKSWIHLNLLMNMAQLHAINVTPSFVQASLKEFSTKFELSQDGRKVCWLGGSERSKDRVDHDTNLEHGPVNADDDDDELMHTGHKRRKLGNSGASIWTSGTESEPHLRDESAASRLTAGPSVGLIGRQPFIPIRKSESGNEPYYRPLFHHADISDENRVYSTHDESLISSRPAEDVTGTRFSMHSVPNASSGRKSSLEAIKQDGPMVFYQSAKFYTDLSGTYEGDLEFRHQAGPVSYKTSTSDAIGCVPSQPLHLEEASVGCDVLVGSTETMALYDGLTLGGLETPIPGPHAYESQSSPIIDFEVSGVGGVVPADNLVISATTRHIVAKGARTRSSSKLLVQRGHRGFHVPLRAEKNVDYELVESRYADLPPSSLPVPSFFITLSSTEESSGASPSTRDGTVSSSNSPDAGSKDVANTAAKYSAGTTFRSNIFIRSDSGSESEADSASICGSGSSIDLLAAARELDPDTIAEREREFDSQAVPPFSAEIPAGSSAATVGGGSGFSSDVGTTSESMED